MRNRTGADSKQDYGTPPEVMRAVERRFGRVAFDLAAHAGNAKAERYFTEADDALLQPWATIPRMPTEVLWLNPPFKNIAQWAQKARYSAVCGARIAMLTPASVGASWFAEHVWKRTRCGRRRADVYFMLGRITFEGIADPYPKDCMLTLFSATADGTTDIWDWRKDSL